MRSAPHRSNQILITSVDLEFCLRKICGGKGIRTPDLLIANETLYQLSYTPEIFGKPPVKVQNLICISTGTPTRFAPLVTCLPPTPARGAQKRFALS